MYGKWFYKHLVIIAYYIDGYILSYNKINKIFIKEVGKPNVFTEIEIRIIKLF